MLCKSSRAQDHFTKLQTLKKTKNPKPNSKTNQKPKLVLVFPV